MAGVGGRNGTSSSSSCLNSDAAHICMKVGVRVPSTCHESSCKGGLGQKERGRDLITVVGAKGGKGGEEESRGGNETFLIIVQSGKGGRGGRNYIVPSRY